MGFPTDVTADVLTLPLTVCSDAIGFDGFLETAYRTAARAVAFSAEGETWLPEALGFLIHHNGLAIATMRNMASVPAVARAIRDDPHGRSLALEHLRAIALITSAKNRRIEFQLSIGSSYGDGTWEAVFAYDELYQLRRARRKNQTGGI